MGEYEYTELDSKSVLDSDGFYTDYTLYQCEDSEGNITYVCIFGDNELYTPDNSDPDFETEDEDEAYEWFESYGESDEDDIYECQDIQSSEESKYTATDIVQDMHNKYPKFNFIEEESFPEIDGPGKIRLYFDGSQWPVDMEECTDYLKSKGLEVYWNHYKICVVADEDEDIEECEDMKKTITSATEDKDLRNRLIDALDTQMISFEEGIIPAIQKYVPEYDREWCAEDTQFAYEDAREQFINSMVDDILLAYYEGE